MKNNINKKARTKSVKNSQGKHETQHQEEEEAAQLQMHQQRILFCQKHHKTYDVTDESNRNELLVQNHTSEFQNTKRTYHRQFQQTTDCSSKVSSHNTRVVSPNNAHK